MARMVAYQRPGRVCPLHYRYSPEIFDRPPQHRTHTAYVIGGLYGNREALAPAATFEDGLMQQRVLDAARKSSSSGGGWTRVHSILGCRTSATSSSATRPPTRWRAARHLGVPRWSV